MNAAIRESLDLFMRMNIFNTLSTGSQMLDMLFSTLIMMYLPVIYNTTRNLFANGFDNIRFYRYNTLKMEGLRSILLGG